MANLIRANDPAQVATIANGQTTSSVIVSAPYAFAGFGIPAAFTGANITFNVSADGATFFAYGGAVEIAVSESTAYDVPPGVLAWPFFQLVSDQSEGGVRAIVVSQKG